MYVFLLCIVAQFSNTQPAKTIQNKQKPPTIRQKQLRPLKSMQSHLKLSRTSQNHPNPPKTSQNQNHLKPFKTTNNHPKPAFATENQPNPAKTTHKYLKFLIQMFYNLSFNVSDFLFHWVMKDFRQDYTTFTKKSRQIHRVSSFW